MRIINISHLFKTPVLSSTEAQSQTSRRKRRRNKGTAQKSNCADTSAVQSIQPAKQPDIVQNQDADSKKRRKRRKTATVGKFDKEQSPTNKSKIQKTTQDKSGTCDSTKIKPENVKQEITELKNSLLVLSSRKDVLERKLNELQEENDRLAKSNEDLKDELQEMTEEALELSVEKQRLLGKIGLLKKQLLNKPK